MNSTPSFTHPSSSAPPRFLQPSCGTKRLGSWNLCPECHAPYQSQKLQPGEFLSCQRCNFLLERHHSPKTTERLWALTSTALLLLFMVNVSPIIIFDVAGNTQSNFIITGIHRLAEQGYGVIALLVLFTAIIIPTLHLLALWYLLTALHLKQKWPWSHEALTMASFLGNWNLIPVYGVAAMAAVFKLDQLGSVQWKIGSLWLALLSLCVLLISRQFDPKIFFNQD